MKNIRLFFLTSIAFVFVSFAQVGLGLKAGAGVSHSPNTITMFALAQYRFDDYFALGPMLQWGLSDRSDYFTPTFGGSLILPTSFWANVFSNTDPDEIGFESSLHVGMGAAYREVNTLRFTNVNFEAALMFDVIFQNTYSLGLAYITNITSSPIEKHYGTAVLNAGINF